MSVEWPPAPPPLLLNRARGPLGLAVRGGQPFYIRVREGAGFSMILLILGVRDGSTKVR